MTDAHDHGHAHDHDHGALGSGAADAPVRILVVCWGNSARSILAEALLHHLGGDRLDAYSAGIEPAGVNPLTLRVLEEAGLPTTGLRSKSVDEYLGQRFDYVITVCDDARGVCPVFPGVHESLHWGLRYRPRSRGRRTCAWPRSAPCSPSSASASTCSSRSPNGSRPTDGLSNWHDRGVIGLHLLRHAHAGDAARWSGDDDVRPLSEKGIRQSERLGRLLAMYDEAPDLFLTSPKLRASQTAEIVAKALDVRVIAAPRLGEPLDLEVISAVPWATPGGPSGRATGGPRSRLLGDARRPRGPRLHPDAQRGYRTR